MAAEAAGAAAGAGANIIGDILTLATNISQQKQNASQFKDTMKFKQNLLESIQKPMNAAQIQAMSYTNTLNASQANLNQSSFNLNTAQSELANQQIKFGNLALESFQQNNVPLAYLTSPLTRSFNYLGGRSGQFVNTMNSISSPVAYNGSPLQQAMGIGFING